MPERLYQFVDVLRQNPVLVGQIQFAADKTFHNGMVCRVKKICDAGINRSRLPLRPWL